MVEDFSSAKVGDLILLHGCCQKTTGIYVTETQLHIISDIYLKHEMVLIFDFVYQGFGKWVNEDANGLIIVANTLPELIITN